MLLAGDIGGTKTLLGLFERRARRPTRTAVGSFATIEFENLGDIIDAFLARAGVTPDRVEAAGFGAAGPVIDGRVQLTNVGWTIDGATVASRFGLSHVLLMNDLQAAMRSVRVLTPDELVVLQEGRPAPHGNVILVAAGTGLGMSIASEIGDAYAPIASEGGHADFAPAGRRQVELLEHLAAERGRTRWEDVLSGPGLMNLHGFTHRSPCPAVSPGLDAQETPAAVSAAALEHRCRACEDALDLFVSLYGSAAANLALTAVATGGVYIGGGIAPKILPALRAGGFLAAFRDKPPMTALLSRMPVRVILNPEAALLGAAVSVNRADSERHMR